MVKKLDRFINVREIGLPRFWVTMLIPLIVLITFGVAENLLYILFITLISFISAFTCYRILTAKNNPSQFVNESLIGKLLVFIIFGLFVFLNLLGWYQIIDFNAVSDISMLIFISHIAYLSLNMMFIFTLLFGIIKGKLDLPEGSMKINQ